MFYLIYEEADSLPVRERRALFDDAFGRKLVALVMDLIFDIR